MGVALYMSDEGIGQGIDDYLSFGVGIFRTRMHAIGKSVGGMSE